jgi:hypothetical protein
MGTRIRGAPGALAVVLVCTIACVGEVSGERAASGRCPDGEVCSELTPNGLIFVGQAFYDEASALRLGPVVADGVFDLGFRLPEGGLPGRYAIEIEGDSLDVDRRAGELVPDLEDRVRLRGVRPGEAKVRIVDPETGELYDRLTFETYEVVDVWIGPAHDPDREVLAPGEEMMGVHLIASDGTNEVRGFDQEMTLLANGSDAPPEDGGTWDCFSYQVPEGATEVEFELSAAGRTFHHVMPVRAD